MADDMSGKKPKGSLSVSHHGLHKFKKVCKYHCKLCNIVLNSQKEAKDHHKKNHGKCYCNIYVARHVTLRVLWRDTSTCTAKTKNISLVLVVSHLSLRGSGNSIDTNKEELQAFLVINILNISCTRVNSLNIKRYMKIRIMTATSANTQQRTPETSSSI